MLEKSKYLSHRYYSALLNERFATKSIQKTFLIITRGTTVNFSIMEVWTRWPSSHQIQKFRQRLTRTFFFTNLIIFFKISLIETFINEKTILQEVQYKIIIRMAVFIYIETFFVTIFTITFC